MSELAEDAPADSALIKQLFFSMLPQNVKAILAPMVEISSAHHLATSADRIVDILKQPAFSATLQPQAEFSSFSPASAHDTIQSLVILQALERLTKELGDMRGRRLIDVNTALKSTVPSISPLVFIAASDDPFQALLAFFPEFCGEQTYSIHKTSYRDHWSACVFT
ncbi:unnamed protein product [Acanthosepion pharaonis]|uniref:Uncharacterized protein n=1 Tax=Acanthosepion pharaonis TaxID=158019 RepID=A0A812C0Z5_ACAPH|nr:unnamed protein product [Sepia pharaonis]